MKQHVVYILDLGINLTFDLYVGGGAILSEFYSVFILFIFFELLIITRAITMPVAMDMFIRHRRPGYNDLLI